MSHCSSLDKNTFNKPAVDRCTNRAHKKSHKNLQKCIIKRTHFVVTTAQEFLRQVRDFPHAALVPTVCDGSREFVWIRDCICMRCKFHCSRAIFSPALAIHRMELELFGERTFARRKERHSTEFVIATPYNDGTDIIQMVRSNCRFHVQYDLRRVCVKDVLSSSELQELTLRWQHVILRVADVYVSSRNF